MTKNELKELVKQHFNLVEVSEEFASAKLEDGTKISNDKDGKFAEGQKLFVETEEGEKVAAPEGEHVTESGIQLIVDAEGTLTGVKYPDEEGDGSADLAEESVKEEEMSSQETESTVVEEEMSAETTEDEVKEEVEEKFEEAKDEDMMEEGPKLEDIIEVIGEVVEAKMTKVDEKMAEIEKEVMGIKEKMSSFASEPAEEKTIPAASSKFSTADKFSNKRAKTRYENMLNKMKNKN
jgi:hypothetical protein